MTSPLLPPNYRSDEEIQDGVTETWFWEFPESHRHTALPFVIRRDFYANGESSGTYRHVDFLALYAVRNGRAVHWIDNQYYGLVRGDVYLMAPGSAHRFCQYSDLELDVFFFQSSLFNAEELAALRECPGLYRLFVDNIETDHRIHLTPEEWRQVEAQIEMMRNEWGNTSRAHGLRLKHEFFHLLVDLAHLLEKSSQLHHSKVEERRAGSGLAEALRFCEEHFDQPLSVRKLAARAFLSPGHFSELFTLEVGMPPAAYVRHIRLEKARSLLKDSSLPVAHIATHCGFKNAAQFSRAFRNVYQRSPLQYRKKG